MGTVSINIKPEYFSSGGIPPPQVKTVTEA